MASIITVVSRFCYRSPTRPLFVAALIFLILITWKFLTTQPDADALMMHSKYGVKMVDKRPQSVHQLHSPLQSPVKKQESRKRLVNKLDTLDKGMVSEHDGKIYDDEENAIDKEQSVGDQASVDEQRDKQLKEKLFETDKQKSRIKDDQIYDDKEKVIVKKQEKRETKALEKGEREENLQSISTMSLTSSHDLSLSLLLPSDGESEKALTSKATMADKHESTNISNPEDFPVGEYNILLTLVNMSPSSDLAAAMRKCLKSICRHSSIKLTFHVVVDEMGKIVVGDFFKSMRGNCRGSEVVYHDVRSLTHQLQPITKVLQEAFSSANSYYNNPIFFISTALYKIFPLKLTRIIMLDVDMRFLSNIKLLFDMFKNFKESTIMGIAQEQSPVYHHILYQYRQTHKDTILGQPLPNGRTGFNSGLVLLNLKQMRKSVTYNEVLNRKRIKQLTDKYQFKGHLGDQDFFTLLSFDYPELFHILPCSWNRQLCMFWKDNGYKDIFDLYNSCSEPIHVYHGNCRTKILVNDEEDID